MEFFVSREGFHRRKHPQHPTYIIQSSRQNGMKPIKKILYPECRKPKTNQVFRSSNRTLLSSKMQYPRIVKIEPGHSHGIRELRDLDHQQPTDLRYCPNININTSACGPTACRKAKYPSWDDDEGVNPGYEPYHHFEGNRGNTDQYMFCSNFANTPRRDFCDICDQVDCQTHSTPSRYNPQMRFNQDRFDEAHRFLCATISKATKFLNIFYSNFVNDLNTRRHLSGEERADLWRQMVAENDNVDRSYRMKYDGQRYHTSAQTRNRMHQEIRTSEMDTTFRDIKRELHDRFIDFEYCLTTNTTQRYDDHSFRQAYSTRSDESRLRQWRDAQRIHRRTMHDINEIRPLLDRMRHNDDAARMVLIELNVILSRLDGYRKFWPNDIRYEQRRRHNYNYPAPDDEGRINQSIWLS